jgi:hypothetical protein
LYNGKKANDGTPPRRVCRIGPGRSEKREEFLVLETLVSFLFGGALGAVAVMVALLAAQGVKRLRERREI